MTEGDHANRRTRRRRATGKTDARAADEQAAAREDLPARRRSGGRRPPGERALRDLVGGAPSQLGVQGALRARDVNRPTADDLDEAEREVQLVRRNWRPDERR